MSINSIGSLSAVSDNILSSDNSKTKDIGFKDMLKGMLEDTNSLQLQADAAIQDFAAGNVDDAHTVMVMSEKASIAFQLTMQVRNKMMDAYQEIMRIQV